MASLPRWITAAHTALRGALLIAGAYLLAGLLWMGFADGLMARIATDPSQALVLQDLKGWAIIAVTALGLFGLSHRTLDLAVRSGELTDLVRHDALTGLPNSALLISQISLALKAAGEQRPVVVLAIHIDGLREVNENLGPVAGDQVLTSVAQRLRQTLAPGDLLGRHEGSSFVTVLDGSGDRDRPEAVSRDILRAVAEPMLVGGAEFRPRASVGISRYPGDAKSPRELIAAATTAMSRARAHGGWQVHRHTMRLTRAVYERYRLENDLRRAVENGELELHYQPQVRLADGEPVGVESLVRWTHPALGPIAPSRFIPIAEESGLIQPMGEWVLARACRQAAVWRAEAVSELRMTVNLSVRQFSHRRLWKHVEQVLRESGLPADRLEIEITEGVLARDPEVALQILRSLRDVGVSIAIDDFGMGYSSLSYLQLLPIDRLKIDRSFVMALERDPRSEAICRTIVSMGQNLTLMTLAEGIETEAQRRTLSALGCDEGQGFLFARPMAALDIPGWLGIEPVRGERLPRSALAV